MEIVDSNDVPLDEFIDELLNPKTLTRLVNHYGAACFVLARAAMMPRFFDMLISSSSTIDSTTRDHIAFVVFHGKESSFIRQGSNKRYRHNIVGMSSSSKKDIELRQFDEALHAPSRRDSRPEFNPGMMERLRHGIFGERNNRRVASTTERAVFHIAQFFRVRERDMPCLVFVDSRLEPVIVPFSPLGGLSSLYADILAPISDALSDAEAFWEASDRLASFEHKIQRAEAFIKTEAEKRRKYEKSISLKEDAAEEYRKSKEFLEREERRRQLTEERQRREDICAKYTEAKSPEERERFLPANSKLASNAKRYREMLKDIEAKKSAGFELGLLNSDPDEMAELGRRANKMRRKYSNCVSLPFSEAKDRLTAINSELRILLKAERKGVQLDSELESEKSSVRRLDENLVDAQETTSSADEERERHEGRIARLKEYLLHEPYGKFVSSTLNFRALDMVRELKSCGSIGKKKETAMSKNVKILMLAANPETTSRLDLEEEIRSIDIELESVKHRENISFVAKQAVRASDLVRLLRREEPDIVHFSGHGSKEGLVVRDDMYGYRTVAGEALARLFSERGVRLIVLNSCYSDEQADSISPGVDAIIGTLSAVQDEAAIKFSTAFYRTLCDGHSIKDALKDGIDSVVLHDLDDVYQSKGDLGLRFFL